MEGPFGGSAALQLACLPATMLVQVATHMPVAGGQTSLVTVHPTLDHQNEPALLWLRCSPKSNENTKTAPDLHTAASTVHRDML
jgi:hypothetical protein